ncbi:MAG: ribonuclease III [Nitrospirota bacterium]
MLVSYSKNLEILEKAIGYSFNDKGLLTEALTHRSFYHENRDVASSYNERLEFLGDSVLGLVIVEDIFNYASKLTESVMAKIKSYLVRGEVLSEIANEISLGEYLRLGKGEEDTGGRRKKSILADAMEAVFGAVYLDSGYATAREVIIGLFRGKISNVITSGQYHDYKTELQEMSQTLFGVLPEYKVTGQEGDEHRKTYTVDVVISDEKFGRGMGRSKKEAETKAAGEAIRKITERSYRQ